MFLPPLGIVAAVVNIASMCDADVGHTRLPTLQPPPRADPGRTRRLTLQSSAVTSRHPGHCPLDAVHVPQPQSHLLAARCRLRPPLGLSVPRPDRHKLLMTACTFASIGQALGVVKMRPGAINYCFINRSCGRDPAKV